MASAIDWIETLRLLRLPHRKQHFEYFVAICQYNVVNGIDGCRLISHTQGFHHPSTAGHGMNRLWGRVLTRCRSFLSALCLKEQLDAAPTTVPPTTLVIQSLVPLQVEDGETLLVNRDGNL